MALRLGLLRVSFGELLDPGHHAGRRHPEQLGGAVHRQPAQVEQHRRDLDPQRHAARRGVGEVQPAGLAAVALQPFHEPVLDVLLGPATLAPQPHRPAPPAVPPPTDIGDLRSLKTLEINSIYNYLNYGYIDSSFTFKSISISDALTKKKGTRITYKVDRKVIVARSPAFTYTIATGVRYRDGTQSDYRSYVDRWIKSFS